MYDTKYSVHSSAEKTPGTGCPGAGVTAKASAAPPFHMDDASLDEFLDDTAEQAGDESGGEGNAEDEDGQNTPSSGTSATDGTQRVDPARTTHQWTPAGVACDACGQVVERRWTGDGGLVCADCKVW